MNNEELTTLIIKDLGKLQDRNVIIQKVCEHSYMNWNEAQRLVDEVAARNRKKIATRQSPILIFLSIGTLMLGLGLLFYNATFVIDFFQRDTIGQVFGLQAGYYRLAGLATGLGMAVGGGFGLWKTLAGLFPDQ